MLSTCETWWTNASVVWTVINASSSILTHLGLTSIKLVLAADSSEIRGTGAVESGAKVLTLTSVHARVANAPLGSSLTLFSISSRWTTAENQQSYSNFIPSESFNSD